MKNTISEKDAISLMKKHSNDLASYRKVLAHVKAVRDGSVKFAKKAKKNGKRIDMDFIISASILHDIGRFRYSPLSKKKMLHGLIGANILKKEGLSKRYQRVCLTHVGVGITKKHILHEKMGLPLNIDYIPRTNEEKIISYADLLLKGTKIITIDEQAKIYSRFYPGLGKKVINFHNRVMKLTGQLSKVKDIKKYRF